tara:strand:+ start:9282 stop:9512 length:231 start_codon:yes stop_codon:yes gene_type:complete
MKKKEKPKVCDAKEEVLRFGNKHPPQKPFKQTYEYYIPTYGTPDCTYKGNKRGRKRQGEIKPLLNSKKKEVILYFD